MTRVQRYARPSTWLEAIDAARRDVAATWLAGGTFVLAGDFRDKPESVIDLAAALPRGVEDEGDSLAVGAGTTFQELAEAGRRGAAPGCLADAALSMMNRNTRNRATVGGNLGADKSCSSLVPILLVLDAEVEVASPADPEPRRLALDRWLSERDGSGRPRAELVLRVLVPARPGRLAAYRRWSRVACDLSVLGAAASYEVAAGAAIGLRVALGGLGPRSRRAPDVEALFEGKPLPSRDEIEAAVAPRLKPISDFRAGADFKRLRGAQLLADALVEAGRPREDA